MAYAIRFENVTKRYLRALTTYPSFRQDVSGLMKRVAGRLQRSSRREDGRMALQDVSFDIPEGESFALIGPNGAGKTSALKLVARVTYPTSGVVRVRGRVGALIEIGGGVHHELTARENIWLYSQILGMSKTEIGRRFDEIVEFAEIGHALDTPVKMYSSGMQLRLGFSIVAHLEPEIFIVDEALAVGDAGFQAKCVERMTKLVAQGRTLVFVSHDLPALEAVCRRGIFLLDGRVEAEGDINTALQRYLRWVDDSHQARLAESFNPRPSRYLEFVAATCHGPDGAERYAFSTGEDLEIRLRFNAPVELRKPYLSIGITDGRPGNLVLCSMLRDGGAPDRIEGAATFSCRLSRVPLLPRVYQIWCSVRSEAAFGDLFDWQPVGAFRIADAPEFAGPVTQAQTTTDGAIHVAHEWTVS